MATTTRRVKYIVQAYRGGKWARVYSTYSYRLAVEKMKAGLKRGRRRLMTETWRRDTDCWGEHWAKCDLDQWQSQSDAERDAKEWARREQ
jgi:hypothetical protein